MTDPSTVPGSAPPEAADLGELARLGTGRHAPVSEIAIDDTVHGDVPEPVDDALPQQQGRTGARRTSREAPADEASAPDEPADDASASDEPADDTTTSGAPADDASASDELADAPARTEPTDDAPAPDEPADDATTSGAPADDAPARTEPTDDDGSVARLEQPAPSEPTEPTALPAPQVSSHVTTTAAATTPGGHRHRRRHRLYTVMTVLLVLALLATAGVGLHLYRTSRAWEDRSGTYLTEARQLGEEVAATRAELDGTQAELDAVRAQLTTAQDRIRSLADEKAQLRDDSEIQRQVVDYQERVTDAAGRVALALDECVQGQNQLIGYMENAAAYDPAELEQFGLDVQALCQAATEANTALQRELAR